MSAPARFATPRDLSRRTLGAEVADVMATLGTPPMPWQQDVLDVAYELDEDATEEASSRAGKFQPRLWYRECRLTVPRQSGKTQKALGRHTHRQQVSRKYGWHPRPLSLYMAQTATDAREKMVEEWFPILEDSAYGPEAERPEAMAPEEWEALIRVRQFLRANGRESVRWTGGGRITVKPPSRTGGHGGSPDAVDLDEAFAHRDATAEQGVRPGMITRTSPQIWVVSTAGTAESEYLWGKVDDGRSRCEADAHARVCYFEWSAYPGELNAPLPSVATDSIDIRDPQVLARCSPALGYTITLDALLADIDSMPVDEARRAYGNLWTSSVARIIPADAWVRCLFPESEATGDLWLAVDASPGAGSGRAASIAIGGWNAAGRVHGEVIDSAPGLSWVADRVEHLTDKWSRIQTVAVDPTGPIGAILPDIEARSAARIDIVDARTMAAACQRFHEAVLEQSFAHIGQDVLDAAVEGAAKRTLLDSWAWARRTSAANIAPLVAVTLAHWQAATHPEQERRII